MNVEWKVQHSRGDAGVFHAGDPVALRSATFHTVERPTLVLGSAQPDTDVDARVAAALAVSVVRRRSGGGAVLLLPGEFVWLDLVIPADDVLWSNDVGQAMTWVGALWQAALSGLGIAGEVHRGGLLSTPWSRQVCFAGVGTGEVVQSAAKLVGVAQRRTRTWARFQTLSHLQWRPEIVAGLVAPPRPTAALLATVAVAPVDAAVLQRALVNALP